MKTLLKQLDFVVHIPIHLYVLERLFQEWNTRATLNLLLNDLQSDQQMQAARASLPVLLLTGIW
jgi:hypothetical protein